MRIKLDENLPARLVPLLIGLGQDVQTVGDEGLVGNDDDTLWNACIAERRFLVTQDLDFSDMRRFVPGAHSGILVVRLSRPGRQALLRRVKELFEAEAVEEWSGCLLVATERKLRIRRP